MTIRADLRRHASLASVAVLAGAMLCANAAKAQPPSTAPDACTLHVWPGSNLRSTYSGWLHGGIVDGAVTGRDGYQKLPRDPLDTERQHEILARIDLPEALGLAGYASVLHDATLDSRTMRTTPGPWQPDAGACHAELAVDDAFYQEDVFSGRYLKVIYRFRRFDGGATPSRTFGQITAEKLLVLPPAKPGDDPQAWLAELSEAFARSISDFGSALQAPPRKHK